MNCHIFYLFFYSYMSHASSDCPDLYKIVTLIRLKTNIYRVSQKTRPLVRYDPFSLMGVYSVTPCIYSRVATNNSNYSVFDQIVLFVFGIRSIYNFWIIYEYLNSYHRIPNSFGIFIKQKIYKKFSKNLQFSYKNKETKFLYFILSQI